jgi:hypothetical protein
MKKMVDYYMPDHKLIVLMLSAINWKRFYGEVVLYTDDKMVEFLKRTGIYDLHLWDEINTDVVNNIPKVIDPNIYWAGAKLFAISQIEPPFATVDVDMWYKQYYEFDFSLDLMYFHREDRTYPYYPPPHLIIEKQPKIDTSKPSYAMNVATLFVNNKELLKEYTDLAIEYMIQPEHNIKKTYDEFSIRMVFAEQILLPLLVNERGYKSKPIIKEIYRTTHADRSGFRKDQGESNFYQEIYHKIEHVWGNKKMIGEEVEAYRTIMGRYVDQLYNHKEAYDAFLKAFGVIQEINGFENYRKMLKV